VKAVTEQQMSLNQAAAHFMLAGSGSVAKWLKVYEEGSVAKIVKLEHAWRRLDGRNDDGFQVAPFPG
ncbi:hypothetical protein AAHE21_26870, partial [Enterobacter hormaechei]